MNIVDYFTARQSREDVNQYLTDHGLNSSKVLQPIPHYLYKFSTLNKYRLKDLQNEYLTATIPALFNDPYDSMLKINFKNSISEEMRNYVDNDEFERIKKNIEKSNIKRSNSFRTFGQTRSYVASLSENYNNSLLWAHYTDAGRGICVEYDYSKEESSFIFPVMYFNEILDLSDLGDPEKYEEQIAQMVSLLCVICKGSDWSYENEWRMVVPIGNIDSPRGEMIPPPIKQIILGPRFIGYWLQKNNNDNKSEMQLDEDQIDIKNLFFPFCELVKNNSIPLKVARINYDKFNYEIQDSVNIDELMSLNERYLEKFFDYNLWGCY